MLRGNLSSLAKAQLGKFALLPSPVTWIHFINNECHLLPRPAQPFGHLGIQDMQPLFSVHHQQNTLGGRNRQVGLSLHRVLQARAVLMAQPTRVDQNKGTTLPIGVGNQSISRHAWTIKNKRNPALADSIKDRAFSDIRTTHNGNHRTLGLTAGLSCHSWFDAKDTTLALNK